MLGVVFSILALTVFLHSQAGAGGSGTINSLLPDPEEVRGWHPEGPSQTASGDQLYQLIGKSAEVFLSEGFMMAISQNYRIGNGRFINLMIFEMRDSDGAPENFFTQKRVRAARF